ncbi:GSU2203 family decaheme c-type cytochrome [soil metagenome]
MASTKKLKVALLTTFSLVLLGWVITATFSNALGVSADNNDPSAIAGIGAGNPDDYVGSETCKACHESQFKNFEYTKHAKLKDVASWKDKVQGCESCHGPGKAHVEGGGDKTKIVTFAGKNPKQISETCLTCHAGKESHNNFRRGEHWRNDVGCTDCHSPHAGPFGHEKAGSGVFVADVSRENPGRASTLLLKANETQLCMSCHQETKSQFIKPFHHKVLEGAMKCSDCHNPHGGFEAKQTKLAVGADAACIKCHGDKGGPFVFEHAPIKAEGCSACHAPHGSSNPKMLNRSSVRQLCMECHTKISETEAPNTPSFHSQSAVRYQNCTICHTAIHGSNNSKVFFR